MAQMPEKELKKLAEKGKERKEEVEKQELKKIRGKYRVQRGYRFQALGYNKTGPNYEVGPVFKSFLVFHVK